jgi:hypothetical protein
MKSEYRSESYREYGERGTQTLNAKIEVISISLLITKRDKKWIVFESE